MILDISVHEPDRPKDLEAIAMQRAKLVKDILARGKTAVFTRPHRVWPTDKVVKKVSKWDPDFRPDDKRYDIRAQHCENAFSDAVCLRDEAYTITEE